ncbi:aminotransferase class I/II-fold pyridoxal phosphate-dependent enzyme [Streptomyces sp. SID13031]|uniref:aminotransferase class I/II-fold pyridoxal phosphate-dependent enzyme n=1 Tax=Streptomyces sp. SID13031 TaxID=2706046 RepID=UPI0013C97ED8|nr:aminotransferase class I/II-fold pyridoxal phosphate-dependent enzyme [Streptomyces sp. SID13031]NEA33215.1 aminotransferase class I/II-fold pyridoxal phosphate-dependent enzyme [Streptomyces sp. SID13031]
MTVVHPTQDVMDILTIGEGFGVVHAAAQDDRLDGRIVTVDGRRLVNFGSCGYTGLEMHPALKDAVAEAVQRYGTQFSTTRAFLSSPQYADAEAALSTLFGRPAAISASTSMGNLAALPILVGSGDVLLLDSQVHRSVRMAARLTDAPARAIPHSNLEVLERRVRELSAEYDKVWFLADGLYSMFGDFSPVRELGELAERYEKLWLYFDDAHSISWTGRNGRGHVLEQLSPAALEKTVVIGSLNKSFGVAGGVMTFPTDALRHRVFSLGWPMIFSGPVPPPMLAGILASARLHLSDELAERQSRLVERIRLFNREAAGRGLPLLHRSETPIRYVSAAHNAETASILGRRLQEAGYFVNAASYPAVPSKRSGLRITITVHQTEADIIGLVEAIAKWVPAG